VTARKIKAQDLVKDIRDGLDDHALMKKYSLNSQQLDQLLGKLVEADFITVVELHERARLSDTQVTRAFLDAQRAIDELDD
jgi:hypothetical protein